MTKARSVGFRFDRTAAVGALALAVVLGQAARVRAEEGAIVGPRLDAASQVNTVNRIMMAIDYRDSEFQGNTAPFLYLDHNGGEHAELKKELGVAIHQSLPANPITAVMSVEGQRLLFSTIGRVISQKRQEALEKVSAQAEMLTRMEKADAQGENAALSREERDRRIAEMMHYVWYGGDVKRALEKFQGKIQAIRTAQDGEDLGGEALWGKAAALAASSGGVGLDAEIDRLADAGFSSRGAEPGTRLWFAKGIESYYLEHANELSADQKGRLARILKDLEGRSDQHNNLSRVFDGLLKRPESPLDAIGMIRGRIEKDAEGF